MSQAPPPPLPGWNSNRGRIPVSDLFPNGGPPPQSPSGKSSSGQFLPSMPSERVFTTGDTRGPSTVFGGPMNEKTCRKRLTSFLCFTIRKADPPSPQEKPTWARSEVCEQELQPGEIANQIKRLNEARGKLVSVAEKKAALAPFQQGQINKLLDQLAKTETDSIFVYTLAQLDKREKDLKNGKRETTTMTVYFTRAPLEHLSAVEIFRNIQARKEASSAPAPLPPPSSRPVFVRRPQTFPEHRGQLSDDELEWLVDESPRFSKARNKLPLRPEGNIAGDPVNTTRSKTQAASYQSSPTTKSESESGPKPDTGDLKRASATSTGASRTSKKRELNPTGEKVNTEQEPEPKQDFRGVIFGSSRKTRETKHTAKAEEPINIERTEEASGTGNGRKALRVILDGEEHLACLDSGSDKNVVSGSFAEKYRFKLRCGRNDRKQFELGSGAFIESIGRARIPCSIAKVSSSTKKEWFHVIAGAIVPLIMGRRFLEETEIFTRHRHLLERCPPELEPISSLKFIPPPRRRRGIGVSMNGHLLIATPDTGSDLNLISQTCAEKQRFHMDKSPKGQVRLQSADGSVVMTEGSVYIESMSLDLTTSHSCSQSPEGSSTRERASSNKTRDIPGEIFYVVQGLPCDVILSDEFLERTDAFNIGTEMFTFIPVTEQDVFGLKIFKYLGPVQSRWNKVKSPELSPQEVHDDKYRAERYRRSEAKRQIEALSQFEQNAAWVLEMKTIEVFDQQHVGCMYCVSRRS